ncbi:MAG: glycosyltransferase [Candidatus Moraniibacteriota bacterium]
MKLFLIKIGKAWNVLKQDGVWRGMKRNIQGFRRLFGKVGAGDILFVTNGIGDSARYRTHYVAEELRGKGFQVSVTVQDNPFLLSYPEKFSIFIFHRVLFTEKVKRFIEAIKKEGKTIIFEADDLVYDPSYLTKLDYFTKMNPLERKLYANGLGGEILADPYVEVATTTTQYLSNKLREKGKRVFIVPNRLSQEDVMWAETLLEKGVLKNEASVRIGYLSGTASHNEDFATITNSLVKILQEFPQVQLVLAGPLELGSALEPFASRIERLPFAGRKEHFANVATLDVNLAPLVVGDPFCESKSELKFFEAGILGVPTVAAATGTFRWAITDGVDGFVATRTEEWQEKLGKFIKNSEFRKHMGMKARETVLAKYTTANAKNEEYYNYLREKIV